MGRQSTELAFFVQKFELLAKSIPLLTPMLFYLSRMSSCLRVLFSAWGDFHMF